MATWKLEDIYKSKDDERFVSDQALLKNLVAEFRSCNKDHVSVANLKEAIVSYERIVGLLDKISSYAFLYLQTRLNEQEAIAFSQSVRESTSVLYSQIVFFTVEIVKLDYDSIKQACEKDNELGKYKSWIEDCFRFKEHILSNEAEEVMSRKNITSSSSWIKMYDEILAKIEIDFEGTKKNLSQITEIASHCEDGATREKASRALGKALKELGFYINHIYNNVILDCSIDKDLRGYAKPESFRHASNNIDQKSVDYLTDSVVNGFKKTSHKYYQIKAKLLGKERMEYWDRNAPIKLSSILEKEFPYEKGCEIVLDTFGSFSEAFKNIASEFINKGWIDVYAKQGKCSGAFACHCSTDIHPYVLLNYFGSVRDVSTLAHELGHGIHMTLAAKNGPILADTPITLSEVASLFAEKILFEKMFQDAKTDQEKIDMLCAKLDDTINSIMRQIAFFEFERKVHNERSKKELSIDEVSKIWMDVQKECLGEYVNLDECISQYWSYISHFFHSPFYVYAYAFGEIFVNALYKNYKDTGFEFVDKYVNMLSKGGIDRYDIAATKFGLNPLKEEFWTNGVDVIAKQIDHLEMLCDRTICN